MTEQTSPTPFSNRCEILSDLWLNYKTDNEFTEFFTYNDLGLPLAYSLAEGIVQSTEIAERFVNETFELLITSLGIVDDNFESLDEMLSMAEDNK